MIVQRFSASVCLSLRVFNQGGIGQTQSGHSTRAVADWQVELCGRAQEECNTASQKEVLLLMWHSVSGLGSGGDEGPASTSLAPRVPLGPQHSRTADLFSATVSRDWSSRCPKLMVANQEAAMPTASGSKSCLCPDASRPRARCCAFRPEDVVEKRLFPETCRSSPRSTPNPRGRDGSQT